MAPDSLSSAEEESGGKIRVSAGRTSLAGRFLISTTEDIRALSTPMAPAFQATDQMRPNEPLAALICAPGTAPRVEAMTALRGLSKPGMLNLVGFGPVDWPEGPQRMAVIYTVPAGGRFQLMAPVQPWQVVENFMRPCAAALKEIHGRGYAHRAIRPDNLYRRDVAGGGLVLGPCVASPAGFDQPAIYEPLETAPADPVARGEGSVRHDLFAFGMTALSLILGREAGAGLDADELMVRRMDMGSLGAVVEPQNVPPEIIDALHSLLTDDPSERWTMSDLLSWLGSGKPTVAPRIDTAVAAMPYTLGGKQARRARSLAYLMGRNLNEAMQHLASGQLRRWVWDEAPEKSAPAEFDRALAERPPEGGEADIGLFRTCNAIMALDPSGPVRFGGSSVDPDGLGPYLLAAAGDAARRTEATKLLRYGLPQKLLERRPRSGSNERRATRQQIAFENLRRWIASQEPWEGYERCLYELNAHLPCRSPMTEGRWVEAAPQLLGALDKAARTLVRAPSIDATAAAFLGSRLEVDGAALRALLHPDEADDQALLDALRMFADLEQKGGGGDLTGVAQWGATIAHNFVDSFKRLETKRRLNQAVDSAAAEGSVGAVLKIVETPGVKEQDTADFNVARAEWHRLEREINSDMLDAEAFRQESWRRGQDSVPLAAAGASFVVFLVTLFADWFR